MEEIEKLVRRRVYVRANELIDVDLQGSISDVLPDTKMLLIRFDFPPEIGGARYQHAVAGIRLKKDELAFLMQYGALGCAITWVPDHQYNPASPFDLSWWRGGAATIADIVLLPQ